MEGWVELLNAIAKIFLSTPNGDLKTFGERKPRQFNQDLKNCRISDAWFLNVSFIMYIPALRKLISID